MLSVHSAEAHPFFAQDKGRPLVMAHRGGAGLWPENTLYAFERAVEMGVDVLETEIHSTADNNLVLLHDSTVNRTTNGTGPISSITLDELKTLDAGFTWTRDGGRTYPFRGKGITVPTLEEVFISLPTVRINIDIKQINISLAAPLCQTIRSFGMADKVMVASFNAKALNNFRQVCPEVATSASKREVTLFFFLNLIYLGSAYRATYQAFQVPEYSSGLRVLTRGFLDTAHARNLKVHVWTINEVVDMERLVKMGVDGIITDYPDRLIPLLKERGRRSRI